MTNVEGFLYLVILIEVVAGLIGFGPLILVYAILRRTGNRSIALSVVGIGILLGGAYAIQSNATMVSVMALFLGVPMAVLVPLVIPSRGEKPIVSLPRIIPCYLFVWGMSAAFPFALVISEVSMVPFFYWHTPLSNGLIYTVLMVVDVSIAAVIFRLIDLRFSPVPIREA